MQLRDLRRVSPTRKVTQAEAVILVRTGVMLISIPLTSICSINSILLADKVLWIWPSAKKPPQTSVLGSAKASDAAMDQNVELYADLEKRLKTTLGRSWERKSLLGADMDQAPNLMESIDFEFLVLEAILEEATQIYNLTLVSTSFVLRVIVTCIITLCYPRFANPQNKFVYKCAGKII